MIDKITKQTAYGTAHTLYFDRRNQSEYRRIVGGVGWPYADQDGFICVLSESAHVNPRLKARHLKIIAEYSNRSVDKIIRRLFDYGNLFKVEFWYADAKDLLMYKFIDKFNQQLPKTKKGIYLTEAPFCDDMRNLKVYMHSIRERTLRDKKTLFFGPESILPGVLSGITKEDIERKKIQEFPAVAGIGFAVAGLDEPYTDIEQERLMQAKIQQRRSVAGI